MLITMNVSVKPWPVSIGLVLLNISFLSFPSPTLLLDVLPSLTDHIKAKVYCCSRTGASTAIIVY